MRPVMIADVVLPPSGWISHAGGVGWLVTHPADRSVTILDPELRVLTRFGVPVAAQRFMASVSQQHLAVATLDELVVCNWRGQVLWRRKHVIPRAGLPCEPNCHLDDDGFVWVYLPAGDELVVYNAATGEEIDRTGLDSSVGAAHFWPHPDGKRLGFYVAMGQDAPLSHLAWLADGRINGRNLPGELLNGFTSTGDRYLALPHDTSEIAIRDLATGAVIVSCDPDEIRGYECDSDYQLMEAAALVSDNFVLVAVNTDDFASDFEDHLLLSARSMRWRANVNYGYSMTQNAIAATNGHGRWITSGQDAPIRLWQLPDSIDEVPGQLQLW